MRYRGVRKRFAPSASSHSWRLPVLVDTYESGLGTSPPFEPWVMRVLAAVYYGEPDPLRFVKGEGGAPRAALTAQGKADG